MVPGPVGFTYKSGIVPPSHIVSSWLGTTTEGAACTVSVCVLVVYSQSVEAGSFVITQ